MVAFPASSSAVSCAVAMQQQAESKAPRRAPPRYAGGPQRRRGDERRRRLLRRSGHRSGSLVRPGWRAGRSAGLPSSRSWRDAGTRMLAPVGELELKGVVGPVTTSRSMGAARHRGGRRRRRDPVAASTRSRAGDGGDRTRCASQHAAAAFKRVAGHQGREVVLIAGEAGQGKTTLAAEAARRAHDEGAIVLLGRCDEELGVPYGPSPKRSTHYVPHAELGALDRHVATHGPALSRLARAGRWLQGIGDSSPTEVDADTERYVLYAAVVGILDEASRDRPVVLVFDDVQWADVASLQLLRHVVKEGDALPLLIIGTYRDAELPIPVDRDVGGAAPRAGGRADRLEGARGRRGGSVPRGGGRARPVRGRSGAGPRGDEETDGNPFFVREMLRHLDRDRCRLRGRGGGRGGAVDDWSCFCPPASRRWWPPAWPAWGARPAGCSAWPP